MKARVAEKESIGNHRSGLESEDNCKGGNQGPKRPVTVNRGYHNRNHWGRLFNRGLLLRLPDGYAVPQFHSVPLRSFSM
eukprot:1067275-Pelagomonas_calceolata.AAC.1